ncbi:MAG: bifunctional 4-hydroxy-2-oxoglutarate aldolase/2-dehydro-3-deoxy-phosphogluconate aldolase [Negativicutes bacterium]|nr:bifunctional 4-hydroxy-2-oxoglutarate aldolase/2-dehydro-3-deoxy-phosphogluconate aldolase [Negativicutes bacterium]
MNKWDIVKSIQETGIVAILRGTKAEELLKIAAALHDGGVQAIEVTCNTPGYLAMIGALADKMGDKMIIGAGTVLSPVTAQLVLDAGAQFVLAPDFNREVVQQVHQNCKLAIPGVTTPSEIMEAYRLGVDVVKLFPAGSLGPRYLKDLRGPLNNAAIMPVGGINLDNLAEFVQAGAFAFGVGSELIDKKAITDGNYAVITQKAKAFIAAFQQAKGR